MIYTKKRYGEVPSVTRRSRSSSAVQHFPSMSMPLVWPDLLPWQASSPLQPPLYPESPILLRLCCWVDQHLWVVKPSPCRPRCVAPTISLCFSFDSASSTAVDHFLPDFTSGCMFLTTWSFESGNVMKDLALATLYSSTTDYIGRVNFVRLL